MKIVIDDTVLIDTIVEKVVERLTPLLSNSHDSRDDEIMDVQELTGYLKVKSSWIYDKVHKREIPFHKVSKFTRFRKKHIDLWIVNPYHPCLSNYNLNHKERR
jgi:excisionase family DNA binding protein